MNKHLLPFVLAGIMLLWDTYVRRGRDPSAFLFGLPAYFASHAKSSVYQSREFCGFRIQWFSSGNASSSLGTPWYCNASNSDKASPIGQR